MALKQAVRWGLIPQIPAEFVDPPKPREIDEDDEGGEVRALTEKQVLALFRRSSPINTQGRRP